MAAFDLDNYFAERIGKSGNDKLAAVAAASEDKRAALQVFRDAVAVQGPILEAQRNSLVGQLGLDVSGIPGRLVNIAANAYSGTARALGDVAVLPAIAGTMANESGLPEADFLLHNKVVNGTATPEEIAQYDRPSGIQEPGMPPVATVRQLFAQAKSARSAALEIDTAFDQRSVVHAKEKEALGEAIGKDFGASWDTTKKGFNDLVQGNVSDGVKDMASGIAQLVFNAEEAAVTHPQGAAEYIAENLPQLLIGGVRKVGSKALLASNVGYASDYYQQGIAKYQSENGGAYPPEATRKTMAMSAAAAAAAEHVGDKVALVAGKIGSKAGVDATKVGFKQALKNTGKAAGTGFLTEAPTEATQTFLEGEASLTPASAKDIYVGGAIGGITGAGMTGGMRALAEIGQATPEHVEKRAVTQAQKLDEAAQFATAVASNDVTPYLNPDSKSYDPSKAVGVFLKTSQLPDTTPEVKAANLKQAGDIVAKLEEQYAILQDKVDFHSTEEIKREKANIRQIQDLLKATDPADTNKVAQLKEILVVRKTGLDERNNTKQGMEVSKQYSTLSTQLNDSRNLLNGLTNTVNPVPAVEEVQAKLVVADTTPDVTDTVAVEATRTAVSDVINLSMRSPHALTGEMAIQLADNTANTLDEEQRKYLRSFSAARDTENRLASVDSVHQEVLVGTPKNVGILQWRAKLATAIASTNTAMADKAVTGISKFAEDHVNKLAAFKEAVVLGYGTQIQKEAGQWQVVPAGDAKILSKDALKNNGGLMAMPKSERLMANLELEVQALQATAAEMSQAKAISFGEAATSAVQSTSPTDTPDLQLLSLERRERERDVKGVDKSTPLPSKVKTNPSPPTVDKTAAIKLAQQTEIARRKAIREKLAEQAKQPTPVTKEAKQEGTQQPAEPSVASEATVAEVPTAKADVVEKKETTPSSPAASASSTPASVSDLPTVAALPTAITSPASSLDASAAETPTPASRKLGVLGLFTHRVAEGVKVAYKKRHLIADYFTQDAGKTDQGTVRPLASVENFLSALKSNPKLVREFLKNPVTKEQSTLLKFFIDHALAWQDTITSGLVRVSDTKAGQKDYRYKDLMQFFLHEEGAVDMDENVKTAISYAAFSAMIDMYSDGRLATPEKINGFLGQQADAELPSAAYNLLADKGVLTGVLKASWGQTAVAALGLKPDPETAPKNLLPTLEAQMGAQVLKLLLDLGVVEHTSVTTAQVNPYMASEIKRKKDQRSPKEMAETAKKTGIALTEAEMAYINQEQDLAAKSAITEISFVRLVRGLEHAADKEAKYAEHSVTPLVADAVAANKGTQSILSNLFAVESHYREPSLEPVPYTQTMAGDGLMKVPSKQIDILKEENKSEHFLRQDLWNFVMRQVSPEIALEMAGYEEVDPAKMHLFRRLSVQAKNDGLIREYDGFMGYVKDTWSKAKTNMEEALQLPIHLEHDAWINQRVGIKTNVINPQSSKLQRPLLYRDSWTTTVNPHDVDSMNNFYLRVGEGLGVKTDKQGNTQSLADIAALFNVANAESGEHPKAAAIQAAVKVLQKSMSMDGLTEAEQRILADGVAAGGEGYHSLDALMSMAHYAQAKGESFTVQMMGEVDGVTNGPMLSHMLLGAAKSVPALFGLLNRGGFFEEGNSHDQYNIWRGVAGHMDLYEKTIRNVLNKVKEMEGKPGKEGINPRDLAAVYAFTGKLENADGAILKAGRNIIKTPLTAIVFSASVSSSVDSMADKFVEGVMGAIEDHANDVKGAMTRSQILTALNNLGIPWAANMSTQEMLDTNFTPNQIKSLKEVFTQTLGKAVKATVAEDFADFLEQRDALNRTAQMSSAVYAAVHAGMREAMLNELMDKGTLEFTVIKGKREPLHDLNAKQEKQLAKQLASIMPMMHTAMSKDSGELDAGLFVGKTERKFGTGEAYTGRTHFDTGLPGTGKEGKLDKATSDRGYETAQVKVGVEMAALSTHAFDSMISHYAAKLQQVLNVHDAHGAGLAIIQEAAKNLNHATWDALLKYSPVSEMHDAYMRTMRGLNTMIEAGTLPKSVLDHLANGLIDFANSTKGDDKPSPLGMLSLQAELSKSMAFRADDMKLQAMVLLKAIDQYALEGGNYLVEETDRKAAQALRDKLTQYISPDDQATMHRLDDALESLLKQKLAAAAQEQGRPAAKTVSQPSATAPTTVKDIFANSDAVTLQQAVAVLKTSGLNEFDSRLLQVVERAIAPNLLIRLVTKNNAGQVLEKGEKGALGWYVSKDGKHEININGNGLNKETLLHELTHAALASTIEQAKKDGKGAAFELVQELEVLRGEAIRYAASINMSEQFSEALKNVHEFVSWGMNNTVFQNKILKNIQIASTTSTNKWISGMESFISKLTALLFGRPNPNMMKGLNVLISNTSGLLNAASQNKALTTNVTANMTVDPVTGLKDFTTSDIFEALRHNSNGATVTPVFGEHLKTLLNGIVAKLYGPYGSYKAAIMQGRNVTPEDVYAEAVATGVAPYAAEAAVAGLSFTSQEAFVFDQVEAVVRAGIDTTAGPTFAAYRELDRLFTEVKNKTRVQDLHAGDWAMATLNEKAEAQRIHDFIFTIVPGADGRSQYLARFAAMGLAHQGFNKVLKQATQVTNKDTTGQPFNERLHQWVMSLLDWFAGRLTHTREGQDADAKLTALVVQLATNEAKRIANLQERASMMGTVTNFADSMLLDKREAIREKMEVFGKLPMFQNSGSGFVRAGGALVSAYGGHRLKYIMRGFKLFRDEHFAGQLGITASLLNEVKGAEFSNVAFHYLLRGTKVIEGKRKDLIDGTTKVLLESFANRGKDLTEVQKAGMSQLLRTDAAMLLANNQYSMADISQLIASPAALQKEIAKLEGKLTGLGKSSRFADFYKTASRALGYKMATGKDTSVHTLLNAGNIARLYDTGRQRMITESEAVVAEAIIDPLVSLYALSYMNNVHRTALQEVMVSEAQRTDQGHGVEMLLMTHKALQDQAQELLFGDSKALYMKGYTPEIYDPYMAVMVADEVDGQELLAQGYSPSAATVQRDQADPGPQRRLYTLRDGGMTRRVSGIVSLTGMHSKGTRAHNGDLSTDTYIGQINSRNLARMKGQKQAGIDAMFSTKNFDPTRVKDTFMTPLLNANGERVNYRYMMSESTKDSLLKRDNRPEKLLGTLAGSIYDKTAAPVQNRKAVLALHGQYQAEFAEHPASYLQVGPTSTDPQLREIYRLLPPSTKAAIREIWGTEGMMVRNDLLDMNFGYRKLSASNMFHKQDHERNFVEKMLVELGTYAFDQKAPLRVRQVEDVWQAVVMATKSNLVIKSWSTFTGNLRSNWSQLILMGVNPVAIFKHHRVALKGAWAYRKDSAELFALQQQVATGYLQPGNTMTAIEDRILRLEDAMARNPVKPLIDAGLMPTIVEDVAVNDDIYSYKSRFTKWTEKGTSKINPHVVEAAKWLLMTEDSTPYKVMSYGAQISDFLARYTLYQHETTKSKKPMKHEEAIQLASDAFINYDIPTHRMTQYLNDTGMVMFTKYYVRIQRMIARLYKNHPGRIMMMLGTEAWLGAQPTVLDSSVLVRWGNPMNMGALDYPGSISSLTTVRLLTAPFTGPSHPGQ